MKTAIKTPAQAEHQLTHVADRFTHWRQTCPTPVEPIPPSLWEQAIALTPMCSLTRVATRLQVSGGEWPKRCAAHHDTLGAPVPTTTPGCVEVPAAPAWPLPTSGIELARHRPDGARLRIAAQETPRPLLAVVQAFLETPSCSS